MTTSILCVATANVGGPEQPVGVDCHNGNTSPKRKRVNFFYRVGLGQADLGGSPQPGAHLTDCDLRFREVRDSVSDAPQQLNVAPALPHSSIPEHGG